jgi:hypothetical protein
MFVEAEALIRLALRAIHLLPQAGEVKKVGALHFSRLREKVARSAG